VTAVTVPIDAVIYGLNNVNNLIDDPKYARQVTQLSKALDQWQLDHFDSALLPESEIVRRSEQCGKTIYEMVRIPSLYDVAALQRASSRALEQDAANLPKFYNDLNAKDAGIRYWAIVGCFNLQESAPPDMKVIRKALHDQSHHVRVMAAWILYRGGDKAAAQDCWNQLLRESSYASLKIFNIIDWIGDGVEPYAEAMKACEFSHGGYVGRMQQYLGVKPKQPKKNRRRKKRQSSFRSSP